MASEATGSTHQAPVVHCATSAMTTTKASQHRIARLHAQLKPLVGCPILNVRSYPDSDQQPDIPEPSLWAMNGNYVAC
jgi:hypothetical protein